MKLIAIEISIEHVPDDPSVTGGLEDSQLVTASHAESFTLSVSQEIEDEESATLHIEKCAMELLRRYRCFNARKTN